MPRFASYLCLALLGFTACEGTIEFPFPPDQPGPRTEAELRQELSNWGVVPLRLKPQQDAAQVELGRALFFDKILSGNRDISCATCHDPMAFLGDGLSLPVGTGGKGIGPARALGSARQFVPRSSPTLLNLGLDPFYIFWDGRLSGFESGPFFVEGDTILLPDVPNVLAAQALLPVLNRVEMRGTVGDVDVFGNRNELADFGDHDSGGIWGAIMDRLVAIPEYVRMFEAAFPGVPVDQFGFEHAVAAIAAFEIAEFTKTDSPFNRWLEGDREALSAEVLRGAFLFAGEAQCLFCHNGALLGGQDFANIGAPQIGPGVGKELPLDLGRGEIDDFDFYRFAFRVPPLRNVELTGPYMHSGAYPTLEAVVEHYSDVETALREYDVSQLAPALRGSHHGDPATVADILASIDGRVLRGREFTDDQKTELLAFLESLTDPSARGLVSLIPARVPSGLRVR